MSSVAEAPETLRCVAALSDAGMHEHALAEVERALARMPDDALLHVLRAEELLAIGRASQAVEAARFAISRQPDLAEAHRILADAIIDDDGQAKAAVAAAEEARRLLGSAEADFTLVRALVRRRRGMRRAGEVARSIRVEHPNSPLGPLALALVEMRKSSAFYEIRWPLLALLVVATQGAVLFALALRWVWSVVKRVPHLRRADEYLRQALEMAPSSGPIRLVLAEVLGARFRFSRAVDQKIAVGAFDSRLVKGDDVIRAIVHRTGVATAAVTVIWLIFLTVPVLGGGVTAPLAAVLLGVPIAWSVSRQRASLTPALRRRLDASNGLLLAVSSAPGVVAFTVLLLAKAEVPYRSAALLSVVPVMLWFGLVLLLGFRARRLS